MNDDQLKHLQELEEILKSLPSKIRVGLRLAYKEGFYTGRNPDLVGMDLYACYESSDIKKEIENEANI